MNYDRLQKRHANLLDRYGAAAKLRKIATNQDRSVLAIIIEYKPAQRGFVIDGAQRALISSLDPVTRLPLSDPPDHEVDLLVFGGKIYRIVEPDVGPRPAGTAIYHDFAVRYDSQE